MSDRPFGHDTLTIPAALVSDSDPDTANNATQTVGADAVRIPAILVPEGGTPPGGDYVMMGVMVRPASVEATDTSPGANADGGDTESLPQTRYRRSGGRPPTPGSNRDPLARGIDTWRGVAGRGGVEQARDTGAAAARKTVPPKAPTTHPADDAARKRLEEARVQAFLRLLRGAENQDDGNEEADYRKLVGGGSVESLTQHPGTQQSLVVHGAHTTPSAAGAYRILASTWESAISKLGRDGVNIPDFSPPSQDKVAAWLIGSRHALDSVRQGNIDRAIAQLNKTWVSLPGGSRQAHGLTIQRAGNLFNRYIKEGSR